MARYLDAAGNSVPAHIAKINGILKSGYRQVLDDGEFTRFDMSFCDAAPSAEQSPILNDAMRRALVDGQNKAALDSIRQNRYSPSLPKLAENPAPVPTTSQDTSGSLGTAEFRDFVRNNRYSN